MRQIIRTLADGNAEVRLIGMSNGVEITVKASHPQLRLARGMAVGRALAAGIDPDAPTPREQMEQR